MRISYARTSLCHGCTGAMGALVPWVHWCHGCRWCYGCTGAMGALVPWVHWCHGCTGAMGALVPWVHWCHGCTGAMGALVPWVPLVLHPITLIRMNPTAKRMAAMSIQYEGTLVSATLHLSQKYLRSPSSKHSHKLRC